MMTKLKRMRTFFLILAGITILTLNSAAQTAKKTDEVKIQTSAQCEMCKDRIETAMAYEKGVLKSNLDLETKVLTVKYKTDKTTAEKIRKAVAALGYDADDVVANYEAYQKLPNCCKKPDDPARK
jgi:periplasmic mercuric ion binding protein